MNTSVEARARELQGDELKIAERVVQWFDLFLKLRTAADTVPPDQLIAQLRTANPIAIEEARNWLMLFVAERFHGEHQALDRRINAAEAAKSKSCPYSAAEYDAAVARVGKKQELLAAELNVDRKTLRKYGRPTA